MAARERKKFSGVATAPTGRVELTPEQIEKAKAALPGISRRCSSAEAEVVAIMRSARTEAKEARKLATDLAAERKELVDMIMDGHRKVDAQQKLFDREDPPS